MSRRKASRATGERIKGGRPNWTPKPSGLRQLDREIEAHHNPEVLRPRVGRPISADAIEAMEYASTYSGTSKFMLMMKGNMNISSWVPSEKQASTMLAIKDEEG